ncbi:winged helix DNA-binding protein [Mesorhizobium sp. ORS 3428]|uniref:winged helix DNA-binding protein n=1 Tax=Mesorhizobium sp. ORS 3428 TaxID=540997 RepID=UPI001FCD93E3|nr:winged helix DNA-binding protein [Mesorhizobium sp. ORS 3428]
MSRKRPTTGAVENVPMRASSQGWTACSAQNQRERKIVNPRNLVVSSAHLATGGSPALSELEYGVIIFSHGLSRWIVRCIAAAGLPGLSTIEILILHNVRHRNRPKTLSDLCLVLDIDDTHIASYAIKKLESAGLVKTSKLGKEKVIESTPKAIAVLDKYTEIREQLLVSSVEQSGLSQEVLSKMAGNLRMVAGLYEQAARSAATL